MATITREKLGTLNDKLTINLGKEDYLPSFEKSLKSYAKSANIPGFRKGMVPSGLIKKMYGQSVFTEEVLRAVEKELHKRHLLGQLNIVLPAKRLWDPLGWVDKDIPFALERGREHPQERQPHHHGQQ